MAIGFSRGGTQVFCIIAIVHGYLVVIVRHRMTLCLFLRTKRISELTPCADSAIDSAALWILKPVIWVPPTLRARSRGVTPTLWRRHVCWWQKTCSSRRVKNKRDRRLIAGRLAQAIKAADDTFKGTDDINDGIKWQIQRMPTAGIDRAAKRLEDDFKWLVPLRSRSRRRPTAPKLCIPGFDGSRRPIEWRPRNCCTRSV